MDGSFLGIAVVMVVGTVLIPFFGLGETTCSAETVFLLDEEGNLSSICDESSLFCMPDWRLFFPYSRKPCHFLLLSSYVLMIYSP